MNSHELRTSQVLEFLTEKQAAAMLQVSIRTMIRWRQYNKIPYVDLNQGLMKKPIIRYRKEDLINLLAGGNHEN